MSYSADKFWQEVAPKLRRHLGLHERSLEEAQEIFDAAEDIPMSKATMERVMRSVSVGPVEKKAAGPIKRLIEKLDISGQEQMPALVLNRNVGDKDPAAAARMETLRKEALERRTNGNEEEPDSVSGQESEGETGGETS